MQILKYFDKGKCWEKGIPLCKELAQLYETRRFDYNKLSDILILEAKFFQNILTQLRPEPEYFRVGFYGMGLPLFVRVSERLSIGNRIHSLTCPISYRTNSSSIADWSTSALARSRSACKRSFPAPRSWPTTVRQRRRS